MLVLGSIVFKNFEPFGTMATIKVHGMLNQSSITYFSMVCLKHNPQPRQRHEMKLTNHFQSTAESKSPFSFSLFLKNGVSTL